MDAATVAVPGVTSKAETAVGLQEAMGGLRQLVPVVVAVPSQLPEPAPIPRPPTAASVRAAITPSAMMKAVVAAAGMAALQGEQTTPLAGVVHRMSMAWTRTREPLQG